MSNAAPKTVRSNIRSIVGMEEALREKRGAVDMVADAIAGFSGTMTFVALHVVWFSFWFLINTGVIPGVRRFDPFPFILLAMIVSVEGVLLSTFVLMKQNRMQRRTDMRDHLNLQIDLLAEKETTKCLQLLQAICTRLEIETIKDDPELGEMVNTTSIDTVAEHIQAQINPE